VLKDAGLVTEEDMNLFIEKNKIRREKQKLAGKIHKDENLAVQNFLITNLTFKL
jgi:hypothetical protein